MQNNSTVQQRGFLGKLRIKFLRRIVAAFPHNKIRCAALRRMGFEVGNDVYIASELGLATMISDNSCHLIIGDRVSIGPRVMLVLASDPNNSKLASVFPPIRGTITIGNDVWIGANVTILPNITIGECSVIASGAVVTKDIPAYTVAGGVPAKEIRKISLNKQ